MYGQHNGHTGFLNGGHSGRFGMGMTAKPSQFHAHQSHRQTQDHSNHSNYTTHQQHNSSSSGFGSNIPHFNSSRYGNVTPNQGSNGHAIQSNEHWETQLKLQHDSRQLVGSAHAYARNSNATRTMPPSSSTNNNDTEPEIRNRAIARTDLDQQHWLEMDMGGQGLRALSDKLFQYSFLRKLYLNSNHLSNLPSSIGKLRNLEHLDLSQNDLPDLPVEIGMLVNLKQLWLFDNPIRQLPNSLGFCHQLEVLGVGDMHTLDQDQREALEFDGTKSLITNLRENAPDEEGPMLDREFYDLDESGSIRKGGVEQFSILSFNTLCDKYATQSQYGYAPKRILSWEYRSDKILQELELRDDDILCLQEVDQECFQDFLRPRLAQKDYRGFFHSKTRARTMAEKEARQVDGCATFYKNSKYIFLDKQHIDFANIAINRPDMKGEHDIFNRVMPRDDIALVLFLEHRASGARLMVANAHIYWNPVYSDVKVVQTAILMEQIQKFSDEWAKVPPCKDKTPYRYSNRDPVDGEEGPAEAVVEPGPSLEYSSGTQIPLVICGDFNSVPGSGVYDLLATGSLSGSHPDLGDHHYGNFTRNGMAHAFPLKSAYGNIGELSFTNWTPGFVGVIDYIWYTTTSLQVTGLLGDVDPIYMQRVPGFPNAHFPSDHLALEGRIVVKARRERKGPVEVDFGN